MVFTCNKCGIAHMYKDSRDHCEHWGRFRTDGKKVSLQQAVDKMFIFNLNRVPGLGIRSIADILPDVIMFVKPPPPPPDSEFWGKSIVESTMDNTEAIVQAYQDAYNKLLRPQSQLSTYEKDGKTYLRVEE